MADGFHIDGSGNLWIGSASNTFTTSAPFYVKTDGTIHAESGDIGGLEIGSTYIQSSNFSVASTTGYRLQSDGNVVFYGTLLADDATISGTITATDGTIGGISINTSDIQSTNYSAGTTGFLIEADGDAFFNSVTANNPIITLGKDTSSGTPTTASSDRIKIGEAVLFNRDISSTSSLVSTKSLIVLADGDEDNPSIAIDGQYGTMGFFVDVPLSGVSRMQITNGNDNVASWATNDSAFTVPDKLVLGGLLQAGGNVGTSGQVLQSTGNGVQWANTEGHTHSGYSFPNSGTLLSSDNHSHGTPLTSDHENANNPHDNYLQEADHNSNNTAHSNFLESADLSGYVQNNDANYLSAVGHTAMAAGNLGYAHGLNLGDILTNSNHSHGNIHNHTGTVLTTAGAGNLYSEPHNHPYSNSNHGHNEYASNSHGTHVDGNVLTNNNHSHSNHSHTGTVLTTAGADNLYATPHNHPYASEHNHPYVTNTTYNNHLNNLHFSDQRLKTNIIDTTFGLTYLNSLRPVDYEFTTDTLDLYFDSAETPFLRDMFSGTKHGFIAQEVRTATFDNHASNNAFGGLGIKASSEQDVLTDIQTLDLEQLVGPIVKAIQELSAKIDLLESRVEELEGV